MARRCRLTSFFRIFVIIPIWIVLGTVSGGAWGWAGGHSIPAWPTGALARAGCCSSPPLLMIGLADEIDAAIGEAVKGLRACGYSWAEIGSRLGITRQAVQQRWGQRQDQPMPHYGDVGYRSWAASCSHPLTTPPQVRRSAR